MHAWWWVTRVWKLSGAGEHEIDKKLTSVNILLRVGKCPKFFVRTAGLLILLTHQRTIPRLIFFLRTDKTAKIGEHPSFSTIMLRCSRSLINVH